MLFTSTSFALFFPLVFILYWFVANKKLQVQNGLLLVSSYFFYACWDYRFLFLLIFSTLLDYFTGLMMDQTEKQNRRKFWFWLSVIINLGFLGVFKYYNFFAASFADALSKFGIKTDFATIQVILPVGISFYTFHGLSYVIDIYKKRIQPVKNFVEYSVFVSFFPLLVAGPIERATHLLPQIQKKRTFDYSKSVDGLRQILWGIFKKVAIADNCADYVTNIYNSSSHYNGSTIALGTFFFAVQIYCDFSGYSDIALGTARLLGIELLHNFDFPFFSKSMSEFWRRWHISLSTWFRDYFFTPLATEWRNSGLFGTSIALMLTFVMIGFWHGAGWNFIFFGFFQGFAIVYELLTKKKRKTIFSKLPVGFASILSMLITFSYFVFTCIFFRSKNIEQSIKFISEIFSRSFFTLPPGYAFIGNCHPFVLILVLFVFFVIEWKGRERQFAIQHLGLNWHKSLRWAMYFLIIIVIINLSGTNKQFIYFQF